MTATAASQLRSVDALEALVLVDNVTDALSTVPPGVANETAALLAAGMTEMAGEAKCCAHHGLSPVLAVRAGKAEPQLDAWLKGIAMNGEGAAWREWWYPCKDHQSDEPDSASLHITAPEDLQGIGNGRLRSIVMNNDGTTTWNWAVVDPINTYHLVPYIGKYAHFSEGYRGDEGPLDSGPRSFEVRFQFYEKADVLRQRSGSE